MTIQLYIQNCSDRAYVRINTFYQILDKLCRPSESTGEIIREFRHLYSSVTSCVSI